MDRNKLRLNNVKSQRDVNEDLYQNISINSDSRPLPYNDILKVVSENDQFNKERSESTRYRFTGTVNSLFTNVLFNGTGERSWETFNTPIFSDRSYPPNGISINEEVDYTFEESIEFHLKEKDGWFGYNNPNINEYNDHSFTYMEPSKEKFDMIVKSGEPNWGVTMTYPAKKMVNELTEGGLDIISLKSVTVGGKKMTAVGIAYKHNLQTKDNVKVSNIGKDGIYEVMRLGLDNGDFKQNYFVIDVEIEDVENNGGKFKKLHYGKECEYYFRVFKRLKNQEGMELGDNDFDSYPLAFSKNVYNDNIIQLATKRDIDIDGLTDNLGRPVSEIYFTIIKNNNKGFSDVKSGLLINNVDGLDTYRDIPDIKRIHNGGNTPYQSNKALNESVLFSDDEFIGDLVEYNEDLFQETVLAEVHHRFNTKNREQSGKIIGGMKPIESPIKDGRPVLIEDSPKFEGPIFSPRRVDGGDEVIEPRGFDDGQGGGETYYQKQTAESKQINTMSSSGSFSYQRIQLLYSKSWDSKICSLRNEEFYFHDGDNWSQATVLVENYDGTYNANAGYYADLNSQVVRYWDGNRFTSTTTCPNSGGSCPNFRSSYKNTGGGMMLGGSCYETPDDSQGSRFYLDGKYYYEDDFAGGSNSSCSSIATNRMGTVVNEFEYGTTIVKSGPEEEIRRVSDKHLVDGKEYTVYVKWTNLYSQLISMESPYFVCNNNTPIEEGEPTNPSTPTKPTEPTEISTGSRQEGYYYKPFNKVQIRNFSNYVEYGDDFTVGIPDYAVKLEDGRYIWRDLLDIGVLNNDVDYPFINGTHYLHNNITFALRRQDPFNDRGLYYDGEIPDLVGIKMSNNKKINKSGDVC